MNHPQVARYTPVVSLLAVRRHTASENDTCVCTTCIGKLHLLLENG